MEKNTLSQNHWWKGTRGEWYVVAQFALLVLLFFGPRTYPGSLFWGTSLTWLSSLMGAVTLAAGLILFLAAIFRLGSNFAAVPYPNEQGSLVETGPYRLVRHPMYCGLILISFGWAFLVHGWLTLAYALVIFMFFDVKSRREEEWLKDKFGGYSAYQGRVRKLIPFIY